MPIPNNQPAFDILAADRQRAIDAARSQPVYARVFWDEDADAMVLECKPCNKSTAEHRSWDRSVSWIRTLMLAAAERHNKEHHP